MNELLLGSASSANSPTDPPQSPVYRLPQPSYHIWTVQDLQVLSELHNPVAVTVSGVFDNPHRRGGLQHTCRTIFQNKVCLEQFGQPRSATAFADAIDNMTEEVRSRRRLRLRANLLGKSVQTRMDAHELFGPVFEGVSPDMPMHLARIHSKAIRVESAGHVETAILHIVETEASTAEMRGAAMHNRSAKHSFLFTQQGLLLHASKAALEAYDQGSGDMAYTKGPHDGGITLKHLFHLGPYQLYPGGKEEAHAALEEGLNDIFNLQLEHHCHLQPYLSSSDGTAKWAKIEMWPMMDPVSETLAVLVKRHDVTRDVKINEQLTTQGEALQRHNQELEQEQRRLEQEAEGLAQRLDAVLQDKFASYSFDSDTPIDKTLGYLQSIIKGKPPSVHTAVELYNVLSKSDTASLRQPVGLEQQLLKDNEMDSEVGQSMLQLLKGTQSSTWTRSQEDGKGDPSQAEDPALPADTPASSAPTDDAGSSLTSPRHQTSEDLTAMIALSVTPMVERFLQKAEMSWCFDIFGFTEATPGNTLAMLTFHLVKRAGFVQLYKLDEVKLCRILQAIEAGYQRDNPYHNSIHVTSVVQMTHMLLCHGGVLKSRAMDPLEHFSSYWSAAIHDYGHTGVNNDFLIKSRHELAITYNDQSPLENFHLAASTRLIQDPRNCFVPVEFMAHPTNVRRYRDVCIDQVLGTDMKKHFDIISRFQAAFKTVPSSGAPKPNTSNSMNWNEVKPQDKTLVFQMVLKCADIGHLAAPAETHKRWAFQLEEEFFRQGDKERAVGLPVSPLMDRNQTGGMTRSQLGFFNIVGLPLFKAMAELFEEAQPMLEGVMANLRLWEQAADTAL
ncbi:hypothetical protein WJX79_004941 [Trebouxia sp. C0005]